MDHMVGGKTRDQLEQSILIYMAGHLYTDSADTGEMKTSGKKESKNQNQNPLFLRHQKTENPTPKTEN